MNAEVRQRLAEAIVKSPDAARGIIKDWGTFDVELQDHYAAEVQWLFEKAPDVIAASEGAERLAVESALADLRSVWAKGAE